MSAIGVVIVNFNGKQDTLDCLASIEKSAINDFLLKTIVVDNASTDGSQEAIKERFPQVKLIANKQNLGFATGNNLGIKWALSEGASYIFILNNDTIIDKDTFVKLIEALKKNKRWGIAAPKIYFAPGFEFHQDRYTQEERGKVIWYGGGELDWKNLIGSHRGVDRVDQGQFGKVSETDFSSGCAMMVKREVFEDIGLFDERYFLYYEDLDFSIRARSKAYKYKIGFYPQAFLWHKNAASARGSGSELQDYYISRNRLLFGTKYASLPMRLALMKESLRLLLSGRKWQRRGVLDFYLGKFGKGSYLPAS